MKNDRDKLCSQTNNNNKNIDYKSQNTDPSEKINNKTKPKRRRYEPKKKTNKETLNRDKFFNKFFKTKVTNISDEIDPDIENSIDYFIHSNSFSANEAENALQEQQFAMFTNLNSLKKIRTPDDLRNNSKIFNDNLRNRNIFDYSETYSKNADSPPNKISVAPYNQVTTHIPDPICKDVTYNNENLENVGSPLTLYEPLYIETNFNENIQLRRPHNVNKHKIKELSVTNNDKEISSHPLYNECEIDQNIYNILLQENSVLQISSPSSIKKNTHHVDQNMFISPKPTTHNEIMEKPKLISDPENIGLLMCSITSFNNSTNYQSVELLRENTRQESTNLMKTYKADINLEAKELNDQLTANFFDETKKEICAVIREVLEKTKQKDKIENELLEAIYNVHRLYEKYQDVSDDVKRSEEKANNILQNIHFTNNKITTNKYFERLLNEFDVKSIELRKSKWKSYVKHNVITLIDGMDYISALNI
ncbi:uncharacterized protein LOC119680184 [Teleopsis dalmanni]|uniref:uncharacterized protein LOC119680106 n=1 Tax=Teleopsis dalmanni TaxID=139649 RepID=UPI0018CF7BDB|nr:uncharacterized protein LOC119680106 [Teleopsis dalmanni]XP_037948811.1 uncharacterized protein LOC119680184 [Teleopsis dalmanni]